MILRQKVLVEVLGEVNTGDVVAAQLVSREGLLLCFSGAASETTNQAAVSSALLSTIWGQFDKGTGAAFGGSGHLKEVVLECEDGYIAACPLANMLLVLRARSSAKLGLLRAKLHTLRNHLNDPLTIIAEANAEEMAKEKRKKTTADDY
ncbi:unnamed protein product, partial [Mesorhabditis spiculigera]